MQYAKKAYCKIDKLAEFYNLDAIFSVDYRVNSRHGVRFRQWATRLLNDHLSQGYTLMRKEPQLTWLPRPYDRDSTLPH